MQSIKIFIY